MTGYMATVNWRGVNNVGYMRLFDNESEAIQYAIEIAYQAGGSPRAYLLSGTEEPKAIKVKK